MKKKMFSRLSRKFIERNEEYIKRERERERDGDGQFTLERFYSENRREDEESFSWRGAPFVEQ